MVRVSDNRQIWAYVGKSVAVRTISFEKLRPLLLIKLTYCQSTLLHSLETMKINDLFQW